MEITGDRDPMVHEGGVQTAVEVQDGRILTAGGYGDARLILFVLIPD